MSEAVIQVAQLKLGYGPRCVLKEASFSIGKGEIVGIIGCNGAGKSTLLKTIRGLLPKQGGRIRLFAAACGAWLWLYGQGYCYGRALSLYEVVGAGKRCR